MKLSFIGADHEVTGSCHVIEAAGKVRSAAILTGPEGGSEAFEADLARIAGLHICSMGERILRCETAPVVAVTALMYATGNLS